MKTKTKDKNGKFLIRNDLEKPAQNENMGRQCL